MLFGSQLHDASISEQILAATKGQLFHQVNEPVTNEMRNKTIVKYAREEKERCS